MSAHKQKEKGVIPVFVFFKLSAFNCFHQPAATVMKPAARQPGFCPADTSISSSCSPTPHRVPGPLRPLSFFKKTHSSSKRNDRLAVKWQQ